MFRAIYDWLRVDIYTVRAVYIGLYTKRVYRTDALVTSSKRKAEEAHNRYMKTRYMHKSITMEKTYLNGRTVTIKSWRNGHVKD